MEVAKPLGEHARLARSGRRDHPGRPDQMAHGGQLIGGQRGIRSDGRRHGGQRAEVDRLAVHDGAPVDLRQRLARPAVDPRRRAAGQDDVGGPTGLGTQAGRLDRPPPHRFAGPAGVVGVGPHEEVQPIEPRLRRRRQAPRFDVDRRRLPEPGGVDAQLDDDRLASRPGRVQTLDGRLRVDEGGLVDDDDRRLRPGCGWLGASHDDHAAAEHGGSRRRHRVKLGGDTR